MNKRAFVSISYRLPSWLSLFYWEKKLLWIK